MDSEDDQPSKKRALSCADNSLNDSLECALFNLADGIREFEDGPAQVVPPDTKLSNDQRVEQLVIRNIRSYMTNTSSAGNQSQAVRLIRDVLSSVIMSTEMVDERLQSAVTRVCALPKKQQLRGITLNRERESTERPGITIKRNPPSHGPKAKIDLDFVYDYFHNHCSLVEVDKSKRGQYKRKTIFCAGKTRKLSCQRRVMAGTRKDLVKMFKDSDIYSDWRRRHGRSIGDTYIKSSICFCIKDASLNECVCVICVQFRYLLQAWDKQRKQWHTAKCTCCGCQSDKFTGYMAASKSSSAFKAAILCAAQKYPHLCLPHLPSEVPEFYSLKCCIKSDTMPSHVQPCPECGWRARFYNYHNCVERTDGPATWRKWQLTVMKNIDDVRPVLRDYVGM